MIYISINLFVNTVVSKTELSPSTFPHRKRSKEILDVKDVRCKLLCNVYSYIKTI